MNKSRKAAPVAGPGTDAGTGAGLKIELDGSQVFVGRGGSEWTGAASRVVLLHGAGMDHTVWMLLGRWLARHGHEVVIPDLPGHGASQGDPLTSIEAMAEWLSRLLVRLRDGSAHAASESLGEGGVTLIGHSMGALIAMQAMQTIRDISVDRLILLGAGYPMQVGPPLLNAAERDDPAAADMITAYGHAYSSLLGHNPLPGIPVAQLARVLLLRSRPGVLYTDLKACDGYVASDELQAHARVSGAVTSVHLIAGDQDRMTPSKASSALADMLGAQVQWLPGSGHMMMTEQPEETLAAVRRALT